MKKTITTIALLGAFALGGASVFAETGTGTSATSTKPTKTMKKVDPVCLQNAVEKRDSALITGVTMQSTSIVAALTARKDAVKAALALPTRAEVNTARKTANAAFEKSTKTARVTMKASRTNAWSTYRTDAKACGQKMEEMEHPTALESAL